MLVEHGVSLAPLTTLGLGGPARRFVRVTDLAELRAALDEAREAKVLILGGGSNLVVRDAGWDGWVIQIGIGGLAIAPGDGGAKLVTVGAGVAWDHFVAQMVDAGLAGLECLSGIPGLVGATPMQNVGAYGQEVADTITSVRAYDRQSGEVVTLGAADCAFGYRTSAFKTRGDWRDRYVVVDVTFRLVPGEHGAPLRYAELCTALGIGVGGTADLAVVRRTIIELRRGKGMVVDAADPESRSAGSFFTNPIVAPELAAAAEARAGARPPQWPQPDGRVKLSAGWLIERAGFAKGTSRGAVGISTKHALALVHRGGGTTAALLALAQDIQAGVRDALGIDLELEPIVI